jgi:hypothetical protein
METDFPSSNDNKAKIVKTLVIELLCFAEQNLHFVRLLLHINIFCNIFFLTFDRKTEIILQTPW